MRAYVFDVDGVLTIPEKLFSHVYVDRHGLSLEPFKRFFKDQFPDALIGQADLAELIANNPDVWKYGTPEAIMKDWFDGENLQNTQAVNVVKELRRRGKKCYLATNQEKYRGNYMKTVMFPGLCDAYFISGEIGFMKPDAKFFESVINGIGGDIPGIRPEEIIFFDDTSENVDGARQVGINARLYQNIDQLESLL